MDEKAFDKLERRALLTKYHSPEVMVGRVAAEAKRRGVTRAIAQRILFHEYVSELLGVCFTTFEIVDKEDDDQAKPWNNEKRGGRGILDLGLAQERPLEEGVEEEPVL